MDGWVRTRDLATVDDDGYLRLRGRTRDVIFVHAELVQRGLLSGVAKPKTVTVIDRVPLTAAGKPDKLTL